jgi:hypothetical protein
MSHYIGRLVGASHEAFPKRYKGPLYPVLYLSPPGFPAPLYCTFMNMEAVRGFLSPLASGLNTGSIKDTVVCLFRSSLG